MIFETMGKEHLKEVESLQREWASENITYGLVAGTVEQISESITPYCLIAKNEQVIIGYLMAEIQKDNNYS